MQILQNYIRKNQFKPFLKHCFIHFEIPSVQIEKKKL